MIDTSILSDHAQRESGWPGEYGTENCSENHQDRITGRYALRHVENLEWESLPQNNKLGELQDGS